VVDARVDEPDTVRLPEITAAPEVVIAVADARLKNDVPDTKRLEAVVDAKVEVPVTVIRVAVVVARVATLDTKRLLDSERLVAEALLKND
jgi:hypothetical protein